MIRLAFEAVLELIFYAMPLALYGLGFLLLKAAPFRRAKARALISAPLFEPEGGYSKAAVIVAAWGAAALLALGAACYRLLA
ncbi:hypothetical protein ACNHKD_17665 [Methylocystis sp. JAN1]|uniref:hypothetical protein n=1 Tax=Methylocystis sp. JAN1 TaxID=3397211 RepID=UPI003FA211B7